MSPINVEEDHLDILQNLEFAIANVYRTNPALMDSNVDNALEALDRTYTREPSGRAAIVPGNPATREVYDRVRLMCEWRLGRNPVETEEGEPGPSPEPVSREIILACLKRLRKSIRMWTKEAGRQGYLNYINQFL